MALFNRNKKTNIIPKDSTADFLKEYASADGINAYNFIQGIRQLDSNYINNDILIERMKEDSIIASAIDMWTEDALQRDPQTKDIFHVELNTPDDYIETELSKGLTQELESFLKEDLRMEKNLTPIVKRVLTYGNCPVKLDFADVLTDEKLELKESNKSMFENISDKAIDLYGDTSKAAAGEANHQYAIDDRLNRLNEDCYNVDWEQAGEDIVKTDNKQLKKLREAIEKRTSKLKSLKEGEVLKEAELLDLKQMIKGRWYTEIIGHGTNIYELSSKQKLIAYMDRDNPDKFIRPDRIVNFSNNTGKHKVTFEIGDRLQPANTKKYFQLERGEAFIENAMTAWQVLAALEDILLLTRMTRSILYRIFSVEVGNKGNKETKDLLERLKNKIKMDETVDVRSKIYNSSLSQVPLGDSIFIPTRNGVGVIDVKTVGGDVNLKDAVDLDYFKDKLFAGLRIPAPFLGFTESLPGGIGDTSLTRMDIRYSRTIARIQTILSEGLKDLCLVYLKLTRTEKALEELPDFKVVFTSVNSAEDISRADLKSTQMETLKNVLEGLKGLGVDIAANSENYEKTRQQIIKEYFGSVMLDKILQDEKTMVVQGPTEGNPNDLNDGGSPDLDITNNIGGGAPTDILSGPDEDNTDLDINADTDTETDIDVDTGVETNTNTDTDLEPRDIG